VKYVEKAEIKRSSKKLLWALPFVAFIIGYAVSDYFLHKADLLTPNVIGKSLDQAIVLLSGQSLGIRLLATREDQTLPEGVILDQLPSPSQKIKTNQNVFVTLSTRRQLCRMPDFWGKKQRDVVEEVSKKGLEVEEVHVHSNYPQTMCVGQYPSAGCELTDKKVQVYISEGKHSLGIMPLLVGVPLKTVQEAYKKFDARVEIFHASPVTDDHDCSKCVIVDQQPVSGAVVDMGRGLRIQVLVSEA